ncbi:MAG: phosphatidylglycerophosphatase [Bacteriovoracaceae bacterium]|nr:phosphatidylglycerophosphatase [Bacteriovoracaceae bacterium]
MAVALEKIRSSLMTGIVTCCGLGFFPKGSGTIASFFATGFWVLLLELDVPRWFIILLTLLITVFGTFAIQAYEKRTKTHDGSEIVIDEWVGMGISLWFIKLNLPYIIAAFVLFRLFDIWKPPGVKYFDDHHLNSWGVMIDDVVAGLYATILIGAYRLWVG